jgi:hypothetical protein
MLPKAAYGKVLISVEHYRKQDELDRKENPHAMPVGWGIPLRNSISKIARETGKYHGRDSVDRAVEETLRYLVGKGILIDYCGDFSFPANKDKLPTETQIKQHAEQMVKELGIGKTDGGTITNYGNLRPDAFYP